MAESLGLSTLSGGCSLLDGLTHGGYRPETLPGAIQEAQSEFTSNQNFAEGVSLLGQNEILKAYESFSQALFANPVSKFLNYCCFILKSISYYLLNFLETFKVFACPRIIISMWFKASRSFKGPESCFAPEPAASVLH